MIVIKTPDIYLKEWYHKKETAVKTAFFAAVIFGLMTHLYQFTNKLYNYDELANTPGGNGASVEQGRWFLKWMGDVLLKHFGGVYSLPLLNGVLSLLLLAVSAALIVEMFQVDNWVLAAFIGGFVFNYVCKIIPNDIVARATAIVIMGGLIGVGVGLLEQFAKQAWLKVIRGEFEGKEYLVFAGTTSIGNNGKNTIVLFKDKLVGPHHCDIVLEGSKYVLVDSGTPMGTIVNGMKTTRHVLRQGDAIAIGNSVLVFNTK